MPVTAEAPPRITAEETDSLDYLQNLLFNNGNLAGITRLDKGLAKKTPQTKDLVESNTSLQRTREQFRSMLEDASGLKSIRLVEGAMEALDDWLPEYGVDALAIYLSRAHYGKRIVVSKQAIVALQLTLAEIVSPSYIRTDTAVEIGQYAARHFINATRVLHCWGDLLDRSEVCDLLSILHEDIDRLIREKNLFFIRLFEIDWFPSWQIDADELLVQESIFDILNEFDKMKYSSSWDIMVWASERKDSLDEMTPIEWLKQKGEKGKLLNTITDYRPTRRPLISIEPASDFMQEARELSDLVEEKSATITDMKYVLHSDTKAPTSPILRKYDELSAHPSSLEILGKFIVSLKEKITIEISQERDLYFFGRSVASNMTATLFQIAGFLRELHGRPELPKLEHDAAIWLGRQCGLYIDWATDSVLLLGPVYSSEETKRMLNTTEKQLDKFNQDRHIIRVRGYSGDWYPRWQFDRSARRIHPGVREMLSSLESKDGYRVPNVTIASWALSYNPITEGSTPAEWMVQEKSPEKLKEAALELVDDYFYR